MANLQNTTIDDSGFIKIPSGSTSQRPSNPQVGMLRFNTDLGYAEVWDGIEFVPVEPPPLGSPNRPAESAEQILSVGDDNGDGVYFIDLPVVGSTPVYCLFNEDALGGGWMLAMKCTRGNTFDYFSSYWTTANTLNTQDLNLNDGDAKFDVFNYFEATDIMSIHPDVSSGGSVSNNLGGWTCHELDFNGGSRITLLEFFRDGQTNNYFRTGSAVTSWPGHGNNGPWSAQGGWRRYGFNVDEGGRQARWGFNWNNETSPGSNDVDTAIWGMGNRQNYSCGDYITCCASYTGVNRSMRAELWVR